MAQQPTVYRIYLLTIWQQVSTAPPTPLAAAQQQTERVREDVTWRFTIEDPQTGQRRSFSNAVALAAALQAEFPAAQPQTEQAVQESNSPGSHQHPVEAEQSID